MPGCHHRLRHDFYRSQLADSLGRWLPEAVPAARAERADFAQRLGDWLNVADAIALSSGLPALEAPRPATARGKPARAAARQDLADQLASLRATLTASIRQHARAGEGGADTEFALYLQRYLDQQRRMELAIDAFRDHARQTLARSSPELARLAMLDALMARLFDGRERQLLSTVPSFLRRRFEQQRRREPAPDAAEDAAAPAWPGAFAREFEQVLLAELDARLRTVTGLVEAYARAAA